MGIEAQGSIWTQPFKVNCLCLVKDDLLFVLIQTCALVFLEVEIKLGVTSWEEANR